jgi:hypothetical protein
MVAVSQSASAPSTPHDHDPSCSPLYSIMLHHYWLGVALLGTPDPLLSYLFGLLDH